jgi:A/G-specific adenine glycosylase
VTEKSDIIFLRKNLLQWFEGNGREFPWRRPNVSNYELIISEVLLQRTRAETVAKFYYHFFDAYPTWEDLGSSTIEQLEETLKPFGLFRRRAQRLFAIASEYHKRSGKIPRTRNQLEEANLGALYIRNAFELFILKKRSPLLDVNMARIIGRFFDGKDSMKNKPSIGLQEMAKIVVNVKNCRELNWSFLDYAALVCRKIKPKCLECCLSRKCRYFEFYIKIRQPNPKSLIKPNG